MATTREAHWPPRSPHEALLSTPGGRHRLQQLAERRSPSPSPIRRSRTTPTLRDRARDLLRSPGKNSMVDDDVGAADDDDDDDEDEETLRLKLLEIQARLKLKKLQKAKSEENGGADPENEIRQQRLQRSKSQTIVNVPVSPVRKVQAVAEAPRSPGRVLLGIDKGLKAHEVSLRSAPSLSKLSGASMLDAQRAGGQLQRASLSSKDSATTTPPGEEAAVKAMTFNERMAAVRDEQTAKKERDARIAESRSKTFDIDERQLEEFKKAAVAIPEFTSNSSEFSRDQVLNAVNKPTGGSLNALKTAIHTNTTRRIGSQSSADIPEKVASRMVITDPKMSVQVGADAIDSSEESRSQYCCFSALHLKKRIIPHNVLTRTLTGKKNYKIPDLLKEVKAPDFSLPDVAKDIVLLGVIASKSEPRQHKAKAKGDGRGKYMVITLTDLKWELELYLFDTGFEKFWKLPVGTVLALLNPNIMPPMKSDTGRFSLVINSSDDTVLEIGVARDLGFCKSVKRDGKTCDSWIDKRHTDFCEFHTSSALSKTKSGRMEVNTMTGGGAGSGAGRSRFGKKDASFFSGSGGYQYNSSVQVGWEQNQKEIKERKQGIRYDRTGGKIYVQPAISTSTLFDVADIDSQGGLTRGAGKAERLRQRLAEQEKERDIARKLGGMGHGLGADYMRMKDRSAAADTTNGPDGPPTPPDAAKLGLLGGKAGDMHLSPVKRKRGPGSSTQCNVTSAIGWGGQLSKELNRMQGGESLQPPRKKTRFVTAKGIREAGRDSLGGDPGGGNDDDDDLDIVH